MLCYIGISALFNKPSQIKQKVCIRSSDVFLRLKWGSISPQWSPEHVQPVWSPKPVVGVVWYRLTGSPQAGPQSWKLIGKVRIGMFKDRFSFQSLGISATASGNVCYWCPGVSFELGLKNLIEGLCKWYKTKIFSSLACNSFCPKDEKTGFSSFFSFKGFESTHTK